MNLRKLLQALLTAMIIACLPGCSGPPEEDRYAIANGANTDVGDVQIRSLLIVSAAEGERGRLLGSLFNTSKEPVEVTIADEDDSVRVTVDGQSDVGLDTNPVFFSSVSEIPGSRVQVTISAGSHSRNLDVPVMDGTLPAYRSYVPSGPPSP